MGRAEMMIKSFGVTLTLRCSLIAMRLKADIGSPWLPVVISTTWLNGRRLATSMSTRMSFGTLR